MNQNVRAETTAELTSRFGAYARTAKSSEDFLHGVLETVAQAISARAGLLYLADTSGVSVPAVADREKQLRTFAQLTPCAWLGFKATAIPTIQMPPEISLTTDACSKIFSAAIPNLEGTFPVVFPLREADLRGFVCVYVSEAKNYNFAAEMTQSLTEACTMLDLVTDRFLQRDLVGLNKLSLSTVSADPVHFMCTLLGEVKKRLGCGGLSFFAKDPTEEVPTFWLVGTAPNAFPETQIHYSLKDPNFTSTVLENNAFCVIHYQSINRQDVTGLDPPRWRDVGRDAVTKSVMFVPVIKAGRPVGLLRCTNKLSPASGARFNSIDLRRADAFASMLMTWHLAAEKEHRFESSLMDISHEIKTGAAGIKSAANFVKRELIKHLSLSVAEDLAQKLNHVANSADSLIKVLPALRRATDSPTSPHRAAQGFRPYADLCKPICELFRGEAESRHIAFRFFGQDQLGLIYADIEDFRHILQNLIANAVKYTLPNREICIRMQRAEHEYAAIHIFSESLPIRSDEREAIFRFRYRAISARESRSEGQGMGLAIARAKARQLHGDVVFRNSNEFNIFSVLIPIELFRPEKKRDRP